jgi:hypothetical protein
MINVDAEEGAYAGYNKAIKKLKNKIKKYRPESDFSEPIVVTFGRKES